MELSIHDHLEAQMYMAPTLPYINTDASTPSETIRIASKEHDVDGARLNEHGNLFRLDTVMLHLLRAYNRPENQFRIGAEVKAAGKFDDIVIHHLASTIFIQLKHKSDKTSTISVEDLFENEDAPYYLVKYFISYMSIESNPIFDRRIGGVVLFTNIDFKYGDRNKYFMLDKHTVFYEKWDDFLGTGLLKFKNEFPGRAQIKKQLAQYAKSFKIGQYLIGCVLDNKCINLCIIEHLQFFNDIIDKRCEKFQPKFISKDAVTKMKNSGSTEEIKTVKEAFVDEFNKRREKMHFKDNPVIDDSFCTEFLEFLKERSSSGEIDLSEVGNATQDNLRQIIGHVLILRNGKIRLSYSFLNNDNFCSALTNFRSFVYKSFADKGFLKNVYFILPGHIRCLEEFYVKEYLFWNHLKERRFDFFNDPGNDHIEFETKQAVDGFFNDLCFAINQPDEKVLIDLINTELAVHFKQSNIDYSFIYSYVHQWLSDKRGMYLERNDIDKLAIRMAQEKSAEFLENLTIKFCEEILDIAIPIKFSSVDQRVLDFLSEDKQILNVFNTRDTVFNALMILRTLQESKIYKTKFGCVASRQFFVNKEDIIHAMTSPMKSVLVIMFETKLDNGKIMELYDPLKQILEKDKKVVLVTDKETKDFLKIIFGKIYTEYEPNITFSSLDSNSRQIVLEQKLVFQDQLIQLKDLDEDFVREMDAAELSQFIRNKTVHLGKPVEKLPYYVERQLKRSEEVVEPERIYENTVLIVDEPGMGKSTFLKKLAYPQSMDIRWKVFINLNLCTKELKEIGSMIDEPQQKIRNFLFNVARLKTDLDKSYFRYCFETIGKTVLLFDGVDEINPYYTDVVIKILENLQVQRKQQLWVSTRPHLKQMLERKLHVLAFTLSPFDEESQNIFFKKFFLSVIEDVDEKLAEEFILHVKKIYIERADDKRNPFLRIPLQNFMLATVLVQDFRKYCHSEIRDLESIRPMDIVSLYDTFIEIKFKIYFQEKNPGQEETSTAKNIYKKNLKLFWKNHEHLALFELFPDIKKQIIFSEDDKQNYKDMLEAINSEEENTGLVIKDSNSKRGFYFIHRTFAEFFSAWFLSKKLSLDDTCEDVWRFMQLKIFNEEFQVVRKFLDQLLNRESNELHIAIINNDIDSIRKNISEDTMINCTDALGRTPLHMCALYFRENVCDLLLKCKPDVNIEDYLFGWTPINWLLEFICINESAFETDKFLMLEKILDQNLIIKKKIPCTTNFSCKLFLHHNSYDRINLLHAVMKLGCKNIIRYLLDNGVKADVLSKNRITPFFYAVTYEQFEIADDLLRFDISPRQDVYITYLAAAGRRSGVSFLIEKGYDINFQDSDKNTPLHVAIINNHTDVFELLVENNADIDICGQYGRTLLHQAVRSDRLNIVKILIQKRANITEKVLKSAAKWAHFEVFKILSENVTEVSDNIYYKAMCSAAGSGNVDFTKYCLDKVDINLYSMHEETPLHEAAGSDTGLEVIKFLIGTGVPVNVRNKNGRTPLHCAAYNGVLDNVKFLIAVEGSDINAADERGDTALHAAAHEGRLEIVKHLVDNGASITQKNNRGKSPLYSAAHKWSDIRIFEFLVDKYIESDIPVDDEIYARVFCKATKWENSRIVKMCNVDIDVRNDNEKTPLHLAAKYGYLDFAKLFVERGASLNIRNWWNETPLHVAASGGHFNVVEFLVNTEGVDINARDKNNRTPLELALENEHLETFQFLYDKTSEKSAKIYTDALLVSAKNNNLDVANICKPQIKNIDLADKYKSLEMAVSKGNLKMVKFLVENVDDINIREDHVGKKLLRIALNKCYVKVFNFLVSKGAGQCRP